jgi:hypothetical protein
MLLDDEQSPLQHGLELAHGDIVEWLCIADQTVSCMYVATHLCCLALIFEAES